MLCSCRLYIVLFLLQLMLALILAWLPSGKMNSSEEEKQTNLHKSQLHQLKVRKLLTVNIQISLSMIIILIIDLNKFVVHTSARCKDILTP